MGRVIEVNGPIVTVSLPGVRNGEQVRIGRLGLVGEVIARTGGEAVVQVYESTESLCPGEDAVALGHPLVVELGPGLLGNIFDGVQRPLQAMRAASGDQIARGLAAPSLDRARTWPFVPAANLKTGTVLSAGSVIGTVPETGAITHRILVPPDIQGKLLELAGAGDYPVDAAIARLRDGAGHEHPLNLFHRWPVRTPRPYRRRDRAMAPLITGQRILDTFFPLLKGGKATIPGPFGAGKTVLQQQIARWSNADIVIYVGCGERGNELADVLESFPKLKDPYNDRLLMERTILVANTSNMPVVAREASIYVGVTLAEYYRDQGYDVLMVADSTSRWAEALREVAGRIGQMPVEEGYPAYLASRLGAFYERAGRMETLAGEFGSVTLIGAVSPPGGDLSEPVTSHTKDIVRVFWALSKELADARHYPAVDWSDSFSADVGPATGWWAQNVDPLWAARRAEALGLLSQAGELARVANLVGPEALSAAQRWVLESAALIREGVLQQNALDDVDSFCSPQRQFALLDLVVDIHHQGAELLEMGMPIQELMGLAIMPRARRIKSLYHNGQVEELRGFRREIKAIFDGLRATYGVSAKP